LGTVIGITGTPGTGKKSVAPLVASVLGLGLVSLPRLPGDAMSHETDESEIDTAKALRDTQRSPPGNVVAYGHLLPYILPPRLVERIVVLRCDPMVLKGRLSRRGYSSRKIMDNVEAELIGVIATDAVSAFGRERTFELDTTTSSPVSAAKSVVRLVRGPRTAPHRIDWMPGYGSAPKLKVLLSP